MVSKPFLWLFALLVLAITGCGGSGGRSDSLIAVWPTSGVYAVSKAPLSDGTLLTLQVGISSTPGKGGIRFKETAPGTAGHMGNMIIRNARATNGAFLVSGKPDEHTFVRNVPEYTYTIQEFQSKLVVYLSRRGRVETLRLDRIRDHGSRAVRTSGFDIPTDVLVGDPASPQPNKYYFGRVIVCDVVSNTDYGDSYEKMMVYVNPDFFFVSPGTTGNIIPSTGGFVVPAYFIGDNINGISPGDSDVGGYVVYYSIDSQDFSNLASRIYLQPNEDGTISTLLAEAEKEEGYETTWANSGTLVFSVGADQASLRYPSAYSSAFIDVGSEVSIGYGLGANPSLVGFTIDDTSAISSLLSGYTGDQLAWAGLSSNELPQINPSNVWVSVLNSSALRTPNDISINLVGNVSLIRDAIVYGD